MQDEIALLEEIPAKPMLLELDDETERKLAEAWKRAWMRPAWVCLTSFGTGHVCGKTFWGERPEVCPRCNKRF